MGKEIETYRIRMDDKENPALGLITQGTDKGGQTYAKRIDGLYRILDERSRSCQKQMDDARHSYKKSARVYAENKNEEMLKELGIGALSSYFGRLKDEIPGKEVDAVLEDHIKKGHTIDDVKPYDILALHRENILESMSVEDEKEQSIYAKCFDEYVGSLRRLEKRLKECVPDRYQVISGFGAGLGVVPFGVLIGSGLVQNATTYYDKEGMMFLAGVMTILAAVGAGFTAAHYIGRWAFRRKVKRSIAKEQEMTKRFYLDKLMELESHD